MKNCFSLSLLACLFAAPCSVAAQPTRVLIVFGPSTHPPGSHEVAAGGRLLQHCLENMSHVSDVAAEVVYEWPKDQSRLKSVNTIVFIGDTFPPQRLPISRGWNEFTLHDGGDWKKKKDEPATDLVWAWTLQALVDEKSRLKVLTEINEGGQTLVGVRVSESISPAMDIYFDKTNLQLVRIDWRKDINRFSDWREHDGAKYPAKCIGYRKATGKPWFVSEIIELRRLIELPGDLQ